MRIFVDTSALFALLDRDDANHKKAKEVWNKVLNPEKCPNHYKLYFGGKLCPSTASSRYGCSNWITRRPLAGYQY